MKELQPIRQIREPIFGQPVQGEQISGRQIRRVVVGVASGAVIGAADNYLEQRRERIKDHPLEKGTPREIARREVVVFREVDKVEVGKAALKGAVHGAVVEVFSREKESKIVQQSALEIAA